MKCCRLPTDGLVWEETLGSTEVNFLAWHRAMKCRWLPTSRLVLEETRWPTKGQGSCMAQTPIGHRMSSNACPSVASQQYLIMACMLPGTLGSCQSTMTCFSGLVAHRLQSTMRGAALCCAACSRLLLVPGDAAAAAAANGTTTLVYIQQAGNAQMAASPSDPLAGTMFMNNALDTTLYDQDYPVRKIGKTSTSNFVNAAVPANATQWFAPAPQARSLLVCSLLTCLCHGSVTATLFSSPYPVTPRTTAAPVVFLFQIVLEPPIVPYSGSQSSWSGSTWQPQERGTSCEHVSACARRPSCWASTPATTCTCC